MEYYSGIRRGEIGSFVEMQMDLQSATQNEVSEQSKYFVLRHALGVLKNGTDELVCGVETDEDVDSSRVDMGWEQGAG